MGLSFKQALKWVSLGPTISMVFLLITRMAFLDMMALGLLNTYHLGLGFLDINLSSIKVLQLDENLQYG